jgi:hypothetical protein
MAKSADKLFTLDVVDTSQAETVQTVNALQQASRDIGTTRLISGLASFGAGINAIAQERKKDEIIADKRTAVNYAIRNEVMPNGLRKEAIQAYDDVVELHGLDKIEKEVQAFYNGDEYKTILENPLISSDEKIAKIEKDNADYLLRAANVISNPATLLGFQEKLKKLQVDQTTEIYNVERLDKDSTSIQTMQFQINNRTAAGGQLDSGYVQALGESFHTSNPWNTVEEAKLTAFNLVVNSDGMDVVQLNKIMEGNYSKNVTFKALANARSTEAGKEIYRVFNDYHTRRRTEFARILEEEIRQTKIRNDEAEKAADAFLKDNADNPNISAQLKAVLEQHGAERQTIRTYLSIHDALEQADKLGPDSVEHDEVEDQILNGTITELSQLQARSGKVDGGLNLNSKSYTLNKELLTEENRQFKDNITELTSSMSTIDGEALRAINNALSPAGIATFSSPRYQNASPDQQKLMALSLGMAKAPYTERMPAIQALQAYRNSMRKAIKSEARRAATVNERPNPDAILGKFETRLSGLVANLEAGIDPLAPKVKPDVTAAATGAVTTKVPPTAGKDDTIDITSSEKEIIIDAAEGGTEEKESFAQSIITQLSESLTVNKERAKTFEPKTFRQRTEEGSMDVKTQPPAKPADKPKNIQLSEIEGEDPTPATLTVSERAKLEASNPEFQRIKAAQVQEELEATGEIADIESIATSEIASTYKESKKSVTNMWTNFLDFFSTPSETGDDDSLFDEVPEAVSKPTPTETPSDVDVTGMVPPMATLPEGEGMDFIGDTDKIGENLSNEEANRREQLLENEKLATPEGQAERQTLIKSSLDKERIRVKADAKKKNEEYTPLTQQEYDKEIAARISSGATAFEDDAILRDTVPSILKLSKLILEKGFNAIQKAGGGIQKRINSGHRVKQPKKHMKTGAHQHHKALDIRTYGMGTKGKQGVVRENVFKALKTTLVNAGYKFVRPNTGKEYVLKDTIKYPNGQKTVYTDAQLWFMFIKDNESFMIELATQPTHIHIQSGSDYGTTRDLLDKYKNKQSNTE